MANLEKVDVKWGIWKILVNSAYRICFIGEHLITFLLLLLLL